MSTLRPNVEEKRIPTGPLCQQDLSRFLLSFLFSQHIPLLPCHSPSTVRERLCYCDGSTRELHWHTDQSENEGANDSELTQHASLISWQRRSIAIWQLNATRPSSKSSRKSGTTSLDQSCSMTSMALHLCCCGHTLHRHQV